MNYRAIQGFAESLHTKIVTRNAHARAYPSNCKGKMNRAETATVAASAERRSITLQVLSGPNSTVAKVS